MEKFMIPKFNAILNFYCLNIFYEETASMLLSGMQKAL